MLKKTLNRREKGQALVEFALISVMLFTLLIGITDLARLYFTYASMSNAAREGTRCASINPYDMDTINERAEALLIVFGDNADIQVTFPDGSRRVGSRVRCRIACDFTLLVLPVPPFEMVADSTMLIETVP